MDKITFYAYKYAPETARATVNGQPVNIRDTAAPLQICTGQHAEAVKTIKRTARQERKKEAAALKAATKTNKSEFITAYIYSYGTTKAHAAAMYKKVVIEEGNTAYYSAIIDGYRQDCRKAFYND